MEGLRIIVQVQLLHLTCMAPVARVGVVSSQVLFDITRWIQSLHVLALAPWRQLFICMDERVWGHHGFQ